MDRINDIIAAKIKEETLAMCKEKGIDPLTQMAPIGTTYYKHPTFSFEHGYVFRYLLVFNDDPEKEQKIKHFDAHATKVVFDISLTNSNSHLKNKMTTVTKKQTVYVAFDIEAGGPGFDHPIVSVGVCHGTSEKYTKARWSFKVDVAQFEKRCYDEFWSKQGELLESLSKEAEAQESKWESILAFIDGLEVMYPSETHKVVFVSDNPAYDISRIDYMLYTKFKRLPLRYTTDGKYRRISDPSEQMKFFKHRSQLNGFVREKNATHTHFPDDDAEVMFLQQVFLDEHAKQE